MRAPAGDQRLGRRARSVRARLGLGPVEADRLAAGPHSRRGLRLGDDGARSAGSADRRAQGSTQWRGSSNSGCSAACGQVPPSIRSTASASWLWGGSPHREERRAWRLSSATRSTSPGARLRVESRDDAWRRGSSIVADRAHQRGNRRPPCPCPSSPRRPSPGTSLGFLGVTERRSRPPSPAGCWSRFPSMRPTCAATSSSSACHLVHTHAAGADLDLMVGVSSSSGGGGRT